MSSSFLRAHHHSSLIMPIVRRTSTYTLHLFARGLQSIHRDNGSCGSAQERGCPLPCRAEQLDFIHSGMCQHPFAHRVVVVVVIIVVIVVACSRLAVARPRHLLSYRQRICVRRCADHRSSFRAPRDIGHCKTWRRRPAGRPSLYRYRRPSVVVDAPPLLQYLPFLAPFHRS